PEGTMLSAKPPAALGRWSIALPTVIDTILKALSPAVPHLIPAAHKGDMGGCSFFGFRPDGSRFLLMNIFGGGWGGRPDEGGKSAATNAAIIRRAADGSEEVVYKATEIEIGAGDSVTFLTAGGGGYGDPRERAREDVVRDLTAGIVSPQASTNDYGPSGTER